MTDDVIARKYAMMNFCRDLFNTNVIGTDFDDAQVFKVTGRNFIQQPGGGGVHVSFSVSWHALGKMGARGHEALEVLLPEQADGDWPRLDPGATPLGEQWRGAGSQSPTHTWWTHEEAG